MRGSLPEQVWPIYRGGPYDGQPDQYRFLDMPHDGLVLTVWNDDTGTRHEYVAKGGDWHYKRIQLASTEP